MRAFFIAAFILVGTIIGAGIFVLPQVFYNAGIALGIFYVIFFGALMTVLNLMYGEIVLRTEGDYELFGYTKKYLGKFFSTVVLVAELITLFGSLLVYQLLGAEFLLLFFPSLGFLKSALIFGFIGGAGVFLGLALIARGEVITNLLIAFFVALLAFFALPYGRFFSWSAHPHFAFLPYGIVLFSLFGQPAVKQVLQYLKENGVRRSPLPIIFGSLFPAAVFIVFAVAVILLSEGNMPSADAFSGIRATFPFLAILGAFFGLLNMVDSFWAIGLYLKDFFVRDLKWKKGVALGFIAVAPFFGSLFAREDVVRIIGFLGGAVTGFLGLVILFLWKRARTSGELHPEFSVRLPSFFFWCIAVLLIGGIIYQLA